MSDRSSLHSYAASLLRRLEASTARNRELAGDNPRLRHKLAEALGQLRAAGIHPDPGPTSHPASTVEAWTRHMAAQTSRPAACPLPRYVP